jgi:hypothetical protein
MSYVQIRQSKIDLYEKKILNKQDELQAILSIESQILQWLKEKEVDKRILQHRGNSLLINKLTYFISEKLEEINPRLIISRGWYKYGPCFEHGRRGEESLSLFTFGYHKKPDKILPEIDEECSIQVPKFLESIAKDGSFPYSYVHYIYSEKCNYPWLQQYYLSKHKLSHMLSETEFKRIEEKELNKAFIEFDRAILDSRYAKKIGLPKQDASKLLEVTCLLNHALRHPEEYEDEHVRHIRTYFTENILLAFAFKNYENTFHTSRMGHKKIITENMEDNYSRFVAEIPERLNFYYSMTK